MRLLYSTAMTYEITTSLAGPEVFARAVTFFAERVPLTAAFPERRSDSFLVLRGQGGEELTIALLPSTQGTRLRGSTLFYDQALERFFSTLPPVDIAV